MNYSADITRYPTKPSLHVQCSACPAHEIVFDAHEQTDTTIKRKHFPRWKIKGVDRAKHTLCPACR